MYEVFTRSFPFFFEGITDTNEVIRIVKGGGRPTIPLSIEDCKEIEPPYPSGYTDLMKECWDVAHMRPTFGDLRQRLKLLIEDETKKEGEEQDTKKKEAEEKEKLKNLKCGRVFLDLAKNLEGDERQDTITQGFDFLIRASSLGSADADYALGQQYELGINVKQDFKRAVDYYKKAGDRGHLDAMHRAAMIFKEGKGNVKQDIGATVRLLTEATKKPHIQAHMAMAELYEKGLGVEQELEKAIKHWRMAANLGDPNAQYLLGQRYEKGYDAKFTKKTAKDPQVAAKLYEAAAKQGHKEAALALSELYSSGVGVARDSVKAKYYLELG